MYNPNKKLIKSTMLIIIAGWNLYAQGGKLSGFITDQKTGEALLVLMCLSLKRGMVCQPTIMGIMFYKI